MMLCVARCVVVCCLLCGAACCPLFVGCCVLFGGWCVLFRVCVCRLAYVVFVDARCVLLGMCCSFYVGCLLMCVACGMLCVGCWPCSCSSVIVRWLLRVMCNAVASVCYVLVGGWWLMNVFCCVVCVVKRGSLLVARCVLVGACCVLYEGSPFTAIDCLLMCVACC